LLQTRENPLIRLRPRLDTIHSSQSRTLLSTNWDGFVLGGGEHGLFVHETRLISRFVLLVDGQTPRPVALSNIEQHSWLGYYILVPPGAKTGGPDEGSGMMVPDSEYTLELRVSRFVGEGVHEDFDFRNYTQEGTAFDFDIEIDADFADLVESSRLERRQEGEIRRMWKPDTHSWDLVFDYQARHEFDRQGNRGTASINRGVTLRFYNASSVPEWLDGRIRFRVELPPQGTWHCCLAMIPYIDGQVMEPMYSCRSFRGSRSPLDLKRARFLSESTQFSAPEASTLAPLVMNVINQAKLDLASLRLYDLDRGEDEWVMAAGLPIYIALYGRDALTAAWQAGILSPGMMKGTLAVLAEMQGREFNDWRDEQPGRMIHEAHTGPLEALNYNPRGRYYGSITTSGFYPVVVSELFRWIGDKEAVRPFVEPALKALRWTDQFGDINGDGFFEYLTRSEQGVKHQAWKDSPSAIVDENGDPVEPPIATCEEQGFVFLAKHRMAELMWWMGDKDESLRLVREANELKKRFNEAFWMEELGYFALGLDSKGRQIRSITSNPGHCLATAIVDSSLAARTAMRMIAPDMFTGWGIRTLSSENPAYNPYSYHRGSIWPVEHGTFALGFMRYGLHDYVKLISLAQFRAAGFFEHERLPEVFAGHTWDLGHPFPAIYPQSNSPQAWSSSAVLCFVQAMTGLYPYAPLEMLLVDPQMPEWLPELTVSNLRVGGAKVSIHFKRGKDGRSSYRVLEKEGRLRVVRQPNPWSLTAGVGERVRDLWG
jgi:glycogen debranching enzyme